VIRIAQKNSDHNIKVGLRLNVDVGQGFVSRFGIDADSLEVDELYGMLNNEPNITVAGIHMHVGRTRNVDAWHRRAVTMIEIADKLFEEAPEFIDLGSGMFGNMVDSLAKQFGDHIPTFEEYAEAVARPFKERYGNLPKEKQPILFTEPGATVANRYVDFIAQVQNIKNVRGKTFIALNCSVDNIGTMSRIKAMPLEVIPNGGEQMEVSVASLVGYTCLEYDVMYKEFTGRIAVGDYIVFGNVGGYSNVSKPPFILWNCPMIAQLPDGDYKIIKQQEKFEDIFNTYVL
jgi:diaminopimelate decarboxylase